MDDNIEFSLLKNSVIELNKTTYITNYNGHDCRVIVFSDGVIKFEMDGIVRAEQNMNSDNFKKGFGTIQKEDYKLSLVEQVNIWATYLLNLLDECVMCGNEDICTPFYGNDIVKFSQFVRKPVCDKCKKEILYNKDIKTL